jgi:putative peptidoglycan lipid II flippase
VSEPVKDSRPSFLKAAGVISALTMGSRVLGLVREQVFAAFLGAGSYADAFQVAFRIPNLLRDLFAEGALSAAFVPTYTKALAEGGRERAHQLSSRLLTVLGAILVVLIALGFVFARQIVEFLAPGFEPAKMGLTVGLTRIMLPFLPLVSFAAVAMGMLNAQGRFAIPAAAPAMFNVVSIVWAAGLWAMGFEPAQVVVGWAIGTVLGGAAQLLIQVPPLWREGWRYRPEWRPGDPGIRAIGRLMAPATVGLAAVEVNILVNTIFASHEDGAVAWLGYAFRILYLPIGIFGVAVGTVATTGLSRKAAAGDTEGLRATLRQGLAAVAFLTVPATVGLILLRVPIVSLIFERGRFDPRDTLATSTALALYSVGLVAYTGVKVLAPAFYALGSPRIPLLASVSAVITNLVVVTTLHGSIGYRAIALGTALGSLVNASVLFAVFQRRTGGLATRELGISIAKIVAASAVMGAAAFSTLRVAAGVAGGFGRLADQLVTGLVPIAVAGAVYFAAAHALHIEEARTIVGAVLRRLRPARSPAP